MFAVMKGCVESPYTEMFWACFMQIITSVTQSLIYNTQNSLIVMRSSPVHIKTKKSTQLSVNEAHCPIVSLKESKIQYLLYLTLKQDFPF